MSGNETKTNYRISSIDILRGLTILVMVFVNDLSYIKNLPWWTYHTPRGVNALTYVDVVFPAFLYIVGMSIPFALNKRLARGASKLKLYTHIFLRAFSLIAIGVLYENGRNNIDPEATGISYGLWNILMFTGVILFWNAYPAKSEKYGIVFRVMKWSGLILLCILLFIFRREVDGDLLWLEIYTSTILGAIGYAYLSACLIYMLFRKNIGLIAGSFFVLLLLNVLTQAGWITFFEHLQLQEVKYLGSLASISIAGMLFSMFFLEYVGDLVSQRNWILATGFTVFLFIAGFALLPLGLRRIGSTPSWCLLSTGIVSIIFIGIFWLVDVKNVRNWAKPIRPAGSNPLLTYLLPDIFYAVFGRYYLDHIMGAGIPGIARSVLFTFCILGISACLTRLKIRLQL